MHNIHIRFHEAFEGELTVVFATCDASHVHDRHHTVSISHVKRNAHPDRLVWLVPENAFDDGCLHASADLGIIGSSSPTSVTNKLWKCESVVNVADSLGLSSMVTPT
jgi:hypothetical protein